MPPLVLFIISMALTPLVGHIIRKKITSMCKQRIRSNALQTIVWTINLVSRLFPFGPASGDMIHITLCYFNSLLLITVFLEWIKRYCIAKLSRVFWSIIHNFFQTCQPSYVM
jgi:hypothetical protein